jgi:small-conductance mechanosensitive channel
VIPVGQVAVVERTWAELVARTVEVMNAPLMKIGATPVSLWTLLLVAVIFGISVWGSFLVRRAVEGALRARRIAETGTVALIKRLVHYVVLVVGFVIALQTVGIELGALLAAGAVIAVGVGLAMQELVKNFVSGIILLAERSIKPGDVLEVEGRVVRVIEMKVRSTIARTRDDEDLIIPNGILADSTVKNYTLLDPSYRIRCTVNVAYGNDPAKVGGP